MPAHNTQQRRAAFFGTPTAARTGRPDCDTRLRNYKVGSPGREEETTGNGGDNRQEESCSQLLRSCPMSHTHTHGYVWRHGRKRMSGKVKTPGGESIYPIPTVQTNHNHLSFLIYWNTTCNGGFGEHLPMFESCCKNSWLNTWLLFSKKFPDIRSQFNHI